ncbi:MAG: sugar kinase [Nostocales cyanobacterium]|nr:MAG: sugar kinase [Nostocales cyanobacterium]TAF13418.1 MAG: sugar kinase [Nostocales cyanobacterium]
MTKNALFIGLITLDIIYLAPSPPQSNQKLVANDYTLAAGGPATNASVTFSYLGNQAKLLGVLGSHPIQKLITADLLKFRIKVIDLSTFTQESPPVSSITVTESTGERAVISINAVKTQGEINSIPADILDNIDLILIDGHQMAVSKFIAENAKNQNIPVVIDGGSWKPGFEEILPFVDYAICSANFYPPNCHNKTEVFNYLQSFKIPHIAITCGEQPIEYISNNNIGLIDVPKIKTVDTLGAGDIFHGAFCHYILQTNFIDALALASNIAGRACQYFGSRRWMEK